ncbi:MAG: tRNA lysidine(34) synthetase TilS [Pseudomonadota bacterium]
MSRRKQTDDKADTPLDAAPINASLVGDERFKTLAEDLRAAWTEAGRPSSILLAVSGGGDSMALLAAATRTFSADVALSVATVDHGLRKEAAREAAQVAATATRLGLPHTTLTWSGDKPSTGLQAAARAARYRLLAEEAAGRGGAAVFTAHTGDDVAENLLMRLARGGGARSLAAMPTLRWIASGANAAVMLARPFLSRSRTDLRQAAAAAGLSVIDDPSNEDPAFERVRVRAFLKTPTSEALGLTPARLAASAAQLQNDAQLLDAAERNRFAALGCVFTHWGGVIVNCDRALSQKSDLAASDAGLFARIMRAVGGGDHRPNLDAADAALKTALNGGKASLAGAILQRHGQKLIAYREPAALLGRAGVPPFQPVTLAAGAQVLFDGRFIVSNDVERPLSLKPFGMSGNGGPALFAGPGDAEKSAPALFDGDKLVASPVLGPSRAFRSLVLERFDERTVRFL